MKDMKDETISPVLGCDYSPTEQAKPQSLGEALPAEMARVRDRVMPEYIRIGAPGIIGLALMRRALDDAARAMIAGDVPSMIRAYEELKGFQL